MSPLLSGHDSYELLPSGHKMIFVPEAVSPYNTLGSLNKFSGDTASQGSDHLISSETSPIRVLIGQSLLTYIPSHISCFSEVLIFPRDSYEVFSYYFYFLLPPTRCGSRIL